MALTDPRSVIREILARRPDLHAAFAPQLSAAGIQVAGLGTSGLGGRLSPYGTFEETRGIARSPQAFAGSRVLDAADLAIPPSQKPFSSGLARQRLDAAIRTRNAPPASGPIPPNMGNWPPAEQGDAGIYGSDEYTPEDLGVIVPKGPPPPMAGGQPPSDLQPFSPPGSWGAVRERQAQLPGERDARLNPRPPPGAGQPPSDLQPFTSPSLAGLGTAFGGPDNPQIASLLAPSGIAPGVGQSQGPSLMPGGPPRIPQPRPDNPFGVPQARPPQPYDVGGRPSNVPPAQFANLPNGPRDLTPGIRAYSGQESRLPQRRPDIPQGPQPPLSPPSVIGGPVPPNMGDMPNYEPQTAGRQTLPLPQNTDRVTPPGMEAARQAARTSLQLKANLGGPGNLAIGIPKMPLGTTEMDPMTGLARSPGFNLMGMQQYAAKPQAPLISPAPAPAGGTMPVPPAGTAPLGTVTSQPLPPPGQTSSLTPQQKIQRTMGASALYTPGSGDVPFPGAPPTPPPIQPAQQQKPFWNAPNIGTGIGAVLGLGAGGTGGAVAGAGLGRLAGKGVKFINNRPPPLGVEPITQPAPPPPQAGTGGIFGQGRSMLGGGAQKILSAVRSGAMPIEAAAKALGMDTGSLRDSLSSMGSAGRGGMGGYGGEGGYSGSGGSGGQYGGGGGYNIRESIGGAYRNR